MEKNSLIMNNLEMEINNKNAQCDSLNTKLKEITSKYTNLENETQNLNKNHSNELQKLDILLNSRIQDYENQIQKVSQSLHETNKSKVSNEKKIDKLNFMLKQE